MGAGFVAPASGGALTSKTAVLTGPDEMALLNSAAPGWQQWFITSADWTVTSDADDLVVADGDDLTVVGSGLWLASMQAPAEITDDPTQGFEMDLEFQTPDGLGGFTTAAYAHVDSPTYAADPVPTISVAYGGDGPLKVYGRMRYLGSIAGSWLVFSPTVTIQLVS